MEISALLSKLDGVKEMPSGYAAKCPAHEDRVASLMVNRGKSQPIVVHCHAGCSTEDVLAAVGCTVADIMGKAEVETTYEYLRADGSLAYRVDRYRNPKTFRVQGKLPPPAERVLYQLPALEWARSAGATVYLVEGEKDVHTLMGLGLVATTNVSGSGAWLDHYGQQLADCHVVVIADRDQVGKAHARKAVESLKPHAASVALRTPRYGKDVTDLIEAGYGIDELDDLSEVDELSALRASTVEPRPIDWAWQGYLPYGKLFLIEGDPGDGKSVLTIDLTARLTRGGPMPDGTLIDGPVPVVMVSAEDDPADTIVPRLMAAGADLDLVTIVAWGASREAPFTLPADLVGLSRIVDRTGARAVFLDPLAAFLPSATDTHNDMSVRQALYPLKVFAEDHHVSMGAVRHLNKAGGGKAIYRGNGSIAFVGAARASYVVAVDPEDPQCRVFAPVKMNIAQKPPTLRYAVLSDADGRPYIDWRGEAPTSAQEALNGPESPFRSAAAEDRELEARARRLERDFLIDVLSDGPLSWADIIRRGKMDGFTEHTLRRTRSDMELRRTYGSDGNRSVLWTLPDADPPLAHLPTPTGSQEDPADSAHLPNASDPQLSLPLDHLPTDLAPVSYAPGQVGKWASGSGSEDPSRLDSGQVGTAAGADPPEWASGNGSTEVVLSAQERYEQGPRVCEKCGTATDVIGIADPLWTYRCVAHMPGYV